MAEDIDKVVKWARSQQWRVDISADGYKRFHTPTGKYVVSYPNTPGNSVRRLRAVLVALAENGLQWPPPSKKELRAQRRKEKNQ